MYSVKTIMLDGSAEQIISFDLYFPIRAGSLWVRPGDVINTPMNYEIEFLFAEESQVLRSRTDASVDRFNFDLFPANKAIADDLRIPIDLRVRIKNLDIKKHVFYIALVARGLEDIG